MKMVHAFRAFFQTLVLLSLFAVVGTAGAWENGSINFLLFLLQTCMLFGCAAFFAHAGRKRIVVRLYGRRARRAVKKRPHRSGRPRRSPLHAV